MCCVFAVIRLYDLYVFFFFQAEDGIRDLVRSHGLGDVYKRQSSACARASNASLTRALAAASNVAFGMCVISLLESVSYTHLTLPTSDLV